MEYDGIDVVIPARNEDKTIGAVLSVLKLHPAIGKIIVVVDADTSDRTVDIALAALDATDAVLVGHGQYGKGQNVRRGLELVTTEYVLFCDADLHDLTVDHVSQLVSDATIGEHRMTIGVPDIPRNYPTERIWAWPWVSGERCLPTSLVRPLWLHGYLMETQLNAAAKHVELPLNFVWLTGLRASYYMSERRIREMQEDAEYGRTHGILL